MIPVALMLALADPAHNALDRLTGCWTATGDVMGKPVSGIARGTWRLGGRYLLFELDVPDPQDPYQAAIVLGDMGGDRVNGWWMDNFGAAYSAAGEGKVAAAAIAVDYDYGDAVYRNRYAPEGDGWKWTIVESKGGTDKPFASYTLRATGCDDRGFAF